MIRPSFIYTTLLVAFASTVLALHPPADKRAQCAATLNIALSVAHRLQDHYYNSGTGQLNGGSLWTDANTLEDLHNLMLATGTDDFRSIADNSYLGRAANNANTNWNSFLGGSNDDAGWIVLALWKMADYKAARGLSNSAFLNSADKIYNIIAGQWDDHCGGGVWWSTAHTYKNAITNELFLLLSAQGYLRGHGQTYLDNAKKTWNWLKNSGMRNSDNLWNDGLTDNCANNGQTTWTYNQGVIASGLANLAVATRDTSLLAEAEKTLDATISHLTTNNILQESCDNVASGVLSATKISKSSKDFGPNTSSSTWMLQMTLLEMPNTALSLAHKLLLSSTLEPMHRMILGVFGMLPDQGGSIFTPKTSASGLEAHVAAAKYGPC